MLYLTKNACKKRRWCVKIIKYMTKTKAKSIIEKLSTQFTDKPALNFSTPYQLLVAVILSAQCTDERVNKVTKILFEKYGTPQSLITLSQTELESYIFSCGLYKSKAEHILSATKDILQIYDGQVPNTLADLQKLAGVGRKTANVVYSVAFKGDAIAVDTHVFRVANRIGLAKATNVLNTEKQLMQILDKKDWSRSHHYLIYLGRSFCKSQKPDCASCPINDLCSKNLKR